MKVAGAFGFLTCIMGASYSLLLESTKLTSSRAGWYLLTVLIFDSVGIPIKLPIGDMSNVWANRSRRRRND
jgi:hypothetical protein